MSGAERYERCSSRFGAAEMDGETVLMDLDTGKLMSFQGSGVEVWRLIECGASVDEIVQELTAMFAVERAVAADDVRLFLGELVARGLAQIVPVG